MRQNERGRGREEREKVKVFLTERALRLCLFYFMHSHPSHKKIRHGSPGTQRVIFFIKGCNGHSYHISLTRPGSVAVIATCLIAIC